MPHSPLGNASPTPSQSSSPSEDPTSQDEHEAREPLSQQERAILDHGSSLLDQEYDFQRKSIDRYITNRTQTPIAPPPYLPWQPEYLNGSGDHSGPHRPPPHEKRKGGFGPPPRIYTGMANGAMGEKDFNVSSHNAYAYHYSQHRRPLIDYVTSSWRANKTPPTFSPASPTIPTLSQVVSAPKLRRYVLILLLMICLPWTSWRWYGRSIWQESKMLSDALDEKVRAGKGWYGTNMRPAFVDMIQLKTMDSRLIPQDGDKNRLIFIGDVHGCYDELLALLTEVKYNARGDHLVFTGDLVAKGPSSSGVVDLALKTRASCVRGNHEDRVLLAHRDLNYYRITSAIDNDESAKPFPPNPGGPDRTIPPKPSTTSDPADEEPFSHGDFVDRQLAKSLSQEQIKYLAACPVILDIGKMNGIGQLQVVHAGLVPGIDLESQDPMGVMHMRTIDLKTHVPSRQSRGTPWFKLWNKYQSRLGKRERSTVIYGHDSHMGLQLNKFSKGIDTGCVSGGKLTALVVSSERRKKAKQEIMSVDCKDYRPTEVKGEAAEDSAFLKIKEDNYGGSENGGFKQS